MSGPGVDATRSMSSTSDRSSWYGKRRPASASASIDRYLVGEDIRLRRRQVVGRILEVALEQPLDLGGVLRLGASGGVPGSGERHPRHRRGLDRQRAEILGLEAVHVRLPARAREHL